MSKYRPMHALVAFIMATLACGVPGPTPTLDEEILKAAVASTLTAAAPSAPTGETLQAPEPQPPATTQPGIPPTSPTPAVLRIVYTNGGDVWLIEGSNPPFQLSSVGSVDQVLISSDGMKVVFTRRTTFDTPAEIRSINVDGSGEAVIMTPAQLDTIFPLGDFLHNDLANIAFVPGTHKLMFNTRAIPEGPGLIKHDNILLLDADTGVVTTLFPPGEGGDFSLSPDGSQLAIILPSSISLVNIDGTNLRPMLVEYTPVMTYSEFMYYAQPVWTADSSALGVAIPSEDFLSPNISGTVWHLSSQGGSVVNVGTISGDFYFPQTFSTPLLSSDLLRVAFWRDTATTNIRDLYLANPDGSAQTVYATGELQWLGWAPDSTHFIYSFGGPMNLQLGVVGGAPTAIGSCNDLRWIDDISFLCLSGSKGSWTLMKGEIGGVLVPIISPAGDFVTYDFNQ
jgi:hypothetical protein